MRAQTVRRAHSRFRASCAILRRLRVSEWVLLAYFAYIALLVPLFRNRPGLTYQPVLLFAVICLLLLVLASAARGNAAGIDIVRDWLPILLTLLALHEIEFFLTPVYDRHYEAVWIRWDVVLLKNWGLQRAIESLGLLIPCYLELCYLLVYGVAAYGVALLYLYRRRESVDRFLTIYLLGTLTAYGLLPYFPSQPPRIVYAGVAAPHAQMWLRSLNLFILRHGSIHTSVFPSAHVSSVFSAAWAMFLLFPHRRAVPWTMLAFAVSVSIATIYGRYHYAADVAAGFAVSLLAAAVCVVLFVQKRKGRCRPPPRIEGNREGFWRGA